MVWIISYNITYTKLVQTIGMITNVNISDLSEILTEEEKQKIKEEAEISMVFEISKGDEFKELCG